MCSYLRSRCCDLTCEFGESELCWHKQCLELTFTNLFTICIEFWKGKKTARESPPCSGGMYHFRGRSQCEIGEGTEGNPRWKRLFHHFDSVVVSGRALVKRQWI